MSENYLGTGISVKRASNILGIMPDVLLQVEDNPPKEVADWAAGYIKRNRKTPTRPKKARPAGLIEPKSIFGLLDENEDLAWPAIRNRILERDEYRCRVKVCGASPGEFSLEVHHIDAERKNNRDDNLVTLCRRCHKGVHDSNFVKGRLGWDEDHIPW